MGALQLDAIKPSYVPTGFSFRRQLTGESVAGIGKHQQQIQLVYTTGWDHDDWTHPVTIYIRPAGEASLGATEGRPGLDLDLGLPGSKAVYHDGWWAPETPPAGATRLQLIWDATTVHSITVAYPEIQFAVRASRHAAKRIGDVTTVELVKVARSVQI